MRKVTTNTLLWASFVPFDLCATPLVFPGKRITVNLAPADIRKAGSGCGYTRATLE
jgi:hypothetical protein